MEQSQRRRGPWTVQDSTMKYENAFIRVQEDQVVRPDGQPGTYGTVEMKLGVAVLPLDAEEVIYLTRQFRYALGCESTEVVSGGIEEGQPPEAAAKRELEEELGIVATELTDLGTLELDTSVVHCPVRLFLARSLSFASPKREDTESIQTLKLSLEEAVRRVLEGRITHAVSGALLLKVWVQREVWSEVTERREPSGG
jgi:8-oxo-dGTP pyrophosphatase MutT (NUDIX family)